MSKKTIKSISVFRAGNREDVYEVGFQSPETDDIIEAIIPRRVNGALRVTVYGEGGRPLLDLENWPVLINWK